MLNCWCGKQHVMETGASMGTGAASLPRPFLSPSPCMGPAASCWVALQPCTVHEVSRPVLQHAPSLSSCRFAAESGERVAVGRQVQGQPWSVGAAWKWHTGMEWILKLFCYSFCRKVPGLGCSVAGGVRKTTWISLISE